jgi:hypothetical protein
MYYALNETNIKRDGNMCFLFSFLSPMVTDNGLILHSRDQYSVLPCACKVDIYDKETGMSLGQPALQKVDQYSKFI